MLALLSFYFIFCLDGLVSANRFFPVRFSVAANRLNDLNARAKSRLQQSAQILDHRRTISKSKSESPFHSEAEIIGNHFGEAITSTNDTSGRKLRDVLSHLLTQQDPKFRSRLPLVMTLAEYVQPSDVLPGFTSGISSPPKKLDERHNFPSVSGTQSALAAVPSLAAVPEKGKRSPTTFPKPKKFQGISSFPSIWVSAPPSEVVFGSSCDLASYGFALEARRPESLTEDERTEAMLKFEMDWASGNPRHPSYSSSRLEDVIILARDMPGRSLVGFAYGKRVHTDLWWLDKFMVVPDRRGRGVGSQLIRQFLEYIVTKFRAKAFFSSTQVHRVSSLKAQHKARDQILKKSNRFNMEQILQPRGIGYYHFDRSTLQDPPSALVVFPLVKDITQAEMSEWTRLVFQDRYFPSARIAAHRFKEFLQTENFTVKFGSDDPLNVLVGILEEQGCPSDIARELAKVILPLVDSVDEGM